MATKDFHKYPNYRSEHKLKSNFAVLSSGLLTILVKSTGNTNTNTSTGNTFSTHSSITGAFKKGPSWLRFFSFVGVVVNFNSA